jgi:hypothetical protein
VRGTRRKTSIEWPADVDERLRALVRLAEQDGALPATSASELLAAMVCGQPADGARLAALITAYRQRGGEPAEAPGLPQGVTPPRRRGRPRRGLARPRAPGGADED